MKEQETVVFAQASIGSDPGGGYNWRDIDVPKVKEGIPPRTRNVTVEEFATRLRDNGMTGKYRVFASRYRLLVTIDEATVYRYKIEDEERV